ncbi:MAG: hypothetical protein K2N64_07595 [Anaeroplasmataceae bacterium]|nr:hypothetical protein [Anaeroplasmataceae bacterium]
MKTEIRLSTESPYIIWAEHYLKCFWKICKFIYHIIGLLVGLTLGKVLPLWNKLYEIVYENRKYLSKVILKILALVEAVILVIFLVQYFYNRVFIVSLIWWMVGLGFGTAGLFFLFWIYHELFGRQSILEGYVLLTDQYICYKLASIIKIFGPPRVGKDTTGISITSILVRFFALQTKRIMAYIRRICYIFDFELVENVAWIYSKQFYQPSRNKRREAFMQLAGMPRYRCFLKERYLKDIKYQELLNEYKRSLKNKVDFKSKYMFDDGISRLHFLDLLNEYFFLWVRVYVVKNFVAINQPYVEDPKTGLMAKENSVYFMALASKKNEKRTKILDDGSKVTLEYQEKVEFPLLDWTIWYDTEEDTWMPNRDNLVQKMIDEYRLRDFKAFYGHFFKHFHIIQICHDSQRMNKKLRELDACYINILNREEIPGALKRNAILSFFQKITDFFASRGELKDEERTEAFYTSSKVQYDFYERLYKATMKEKYILKMEAIERKRIKQSGRITEAFKSWNKILLEKIRQNSSRYGIIRITATISDQPVAVNLQETTLKKLLDRNKPMFHESFKIDLYFRMTDSMGRYNDRYMESIAEARAVESCLDFYHVTNWDKRMQILRDTIVRMGYPAGQNFMKVDKEELFEARYIPIINNNQNNKGEQRI